MKSNNRCKANHSYYTQEIPIAIKQSGFFIVLVSLGLVTLDNLEYLENLEELEKNNRRIHIRRLSLNFF